MTIRRTEEWLTDHLRNRVAASGISTVDIGAPFKLPANEAGAFARGRMPAAKMNKLETAYAEHLEARKSKGAILWWRREPMRLRLADGSYYKPDFGVLPANGLFELHETKGFWREAAKARLKIAAELFPFVFKVVTKGEAGIWNIEEVSR